MEKWRGASEQDRMNSRLLPFQAATGVLRRRPDPSGAQDRVDPRELARVFWARRRIVLGAMLVGAVLTYLIVSMMTPRFEGLAKVMLEARKPQMSNSQQVVPDLAVTDQVVNSEVSVLTSNVLIEQAIDLIGMARLDSMDPALQPPSIIGRIMGVFASKSASSDTSMTPEQLKKERLVDAITKSLTVKREDQSNVLDIQILNKDRVLAPLIANAMAQAYIEGQVNGRRLTAGDATQWLQRRVDQLKVDVETAEKQVDKFRAENLITDGGSLDAATQQLGELNNQLVLARADRIAAEASYNRLQNVIAKGGITAVGDIVSSPALDALNTSLQALQRQDAIWAANYGPTHPERVRLAGEMKGIQGDITQEVQKLVEQRKSALATAQLREQTMMASIADMEKRVVTLSRSTIDLRQLERVASSAQSAYNDALTRLNNTRTEEQMQQPDSVLIARATQSSLPATPRKMLMTFIGALSGLALGLGAVFFKEMAQTTFKLASEIESDTGLPLIASIPQESWTTPLEALTELSVRPYGLYAERIRHLRTAILARDTKVKARSVIFMSSVPGESKTTTTLALAQMAALAGRSVIVVDCDLRRTTLSQTFPVNRQYDLADFIFNKCALSDAIHSDPKLSFDILAANTRRPDAADELSISWLQPMIDALKSRYDLVLIDAPALLAVSDALILAQVVDERYFLVRWHSTARDAVLKGISQLAEAGVSLDGVVMTLVDPKSRGELYADAYDYSA